MLTIPKVSKSTVLIKIIKIVIYYLSLLSLSFFIIINIHELGHTYTARLLGDANAHYKLIEISKDGKITAIGKNVYNLGLFNWQKIILISIAGVLASQLFTIAVIFIHQKLTISNKHLRRFLYILIQAGVFDLVFQELQGLLSNIKNRTAICSTGVCGNDFADIFYIIYRRFSINPFIIKILSIGIIMIYMEFLNFIKSKHAQKQN